VIAVVIAAGVALVAVRIFLHRAPLITILGIGLLGLALHSGALRLPTAVVAPITRIHVALLSWQQRASATLACDVASSDTVQGMTSPATERVARGCGLADPAGDSPAPASGPAPSR
jgi:hypothetical protein